MRTIISIFFFTMALSSYSQSVFDSHFYAKTLRIDFTLSGNSKTTQAALYQLYEEPHWGGRQTNLNKSLGLGDFQICVKDKEKSTIYEEGFASLFEEWQCTKEAKKINRSFPNTCIIPYPKHQADIYIIKRQAGEFSDTLLQFNFTPHSAIVQKSTPPDYTVDTIHYNNTPAHALDIAIIGDGFKANEMKEFKKLSHELQETLCSAAVFKKNMNRMNFYAIECPSPETGTDNLGKKQWRNTLFNSGFYTLYSERYLMAQDIWRIREAASLVPYDQIYIIVNTPKYGGGGIYNYYAICSAYGQSSEEVLIHEFGHSFAALADEYSYDDEMLIDYISLKREPWQKNITTLVDFDQKWKDMLKPNTPIPTPKGKAKKYPIGAYEGAISRGVYRACPDCRMRTNEADDFCPVCERAIQEVIDFICE